MAPINVVLALMIVVSFLITIIIHEYAHALVASMLGDPTPKYEGRQSLGLRAHIDPMGTLLSVILAFLPVIAGPIGLGWGKPGKTDPWKLRGGPNIGSLIVALGGLLTSLALGLLVGALIRFLPLGLLPSPIPGLPPADAITARIGQFITVFASVNIALAIFNLLPIYPLDGYQILYTFLPSRQAVQFAKSAQYGPMIILVLLFLLPFLGQLTGLSGLFIFRIPYYILLGALSLIGLVSGVPLVSVGSFYFF